MKQIVLIATLVLSPFTAQADGHADMSFFITSAGSGDGANLGGLDGLVVEAVGDACHVDLHMLNGSGSYLASFLLMSGMS